jgi:translation initiation factor IF-3
MPKISGHYKGRKYSKRGPRKNEQIQAKEVRVVDSNSKQLGVFPTNKAIKLAKKYQLDLVEVSPSARPPVCQISDYGKYVYDLTKKEKENKTKSNTKIKEIKLRVRIEGHDYITKLRRAEEFLFNGNKVKITLSFRGREMEYKNLGFDLVKKTMQELQHIALKDSEPRLSGRNISVMISPIPKEKRKLKYNDEAPQSDN